LFFLDVLIETMFNPGNGVNDCQAPWKRHACRMVYFEFKSYFDKIRDVRDEMERDGVVPVNSFNIDCFVDRYFRHTFAGYFSRVSYVRLDEGDGYPNTQAGEMLNYQSQPVVVVTRQKSPRYGRCQFLRPLNMDATQLLLERNMLMQNRAAGVAHGDHDEDGANAAAFDGAANRFSNVLSQLPCNWKTAHEAYKLNYNFSFISICLRETGVSVASYIMLRGFIQVLAEMSVKGRNWMTSTGAGVSNFNRIAAIKMYEDYSYRDLHYHDREKFKNHMKNFGNLFKIDFWVDNPKVDELGFFEAWIQKLAENRTDKSRLDCLINTIDDLDLNRLGQLIVYSKDKKNTHVIPPVELHVEVSMEKHNADKVKEMNRSVRRCNNIESWCKTLQLCKDRGVLTNMFLQSIMKLRILWCTKYKMFVNLVENKPLADALVLELRNMHYNHSLNINELQETFGEDEV
jgi:hypothetical protein